jgi:isocitrate/isopropylmalate dehydrogenase
MIFWQLRVLSWTRLISTVGYNPNMDKFADTPADEIAVGLRVITRKAARRIIRKAFEYARRRMAGAITERYKEFIKA